MSNKHNNKLIARKGIGAPPPAPSQSNIRGQPPPYNQRSSVTNKTGPEQAKIVNIMFTNEIPTQGLGNGIIGPPNNNLISIGGEVL